MSGGRDWAYRISGIHPAVVVTTYLVASLVPMLTIYGSNAAVVLMPLVLILLGVWLLALYAVSARVIRMRGQRSGRWWLTHIALITGGFVWSAQILHELAGMGSSQLKPLAAVPVVFGLFGSHAVTAAALQKAARPEVGSFGYTVLYLLGLLYLLIGIWFLWPIIKRVRLASTAADDPLGEFI